MGAPRFAVQNTRQGGGAEGLNDYYISGVFTNEFTKDQDLLLT